MTSEVSFGMDIRETVGWSFLKFLARRNNEITPPNMVKSISCC